MPEPGPLAEGEAVIYSGDARWTGGTGKDEIPMLGDTVEIHVPEQTFFAEVAGIRRWAELPDGIVIIAFKVDDIEVRGFEARLA